MHASMRRSALTLVMAFLLVSATACGGADTDQPPAGETEVTGMPAEFPADVPVHPGTVTQYTPTQVTDTAIVHQLYVESSASFAEVTEWYQTALPAGWSVGYFEDVDGEGKEGKIALDGEGYTPANPDGVGGGVLVGVFVTDDATQIVTTVALMETP